MDSPAARRAGNVLLIDLDAVVQNWRAVAARVAPAECAAVVKADAYGLGAVPVARALWRAGARTFFVAELEAGVRLRAALPEARLVVLHGIPAGTEGDLADNGLIPVANTLGDLERWRAKAVALGRTLPVIGHIDTGMNRIGLETAELDRLAADPAGLLRGLSVQAWMSHLACADHPGNPMSAAQLGRFRAALARLPKAPASLSNSAGIFHGRDYHFDLVRPGIALHGGNPTPWQDNPMRPVVRLLGRILQVRHVDAPMTVGYDATHRVQGPGTVVGFSIGYADGYPWAASGKGVARIEGYPAPVIGRVSMDLLTVDASAVPPEHLHEGGWVEVIGPWRSVDQVAQEGGTISYEVLTRLGSRYHRVYLGSQ